MFELKLEGGFNSKGPITVKVDADSFEHNTDSGMINFRKEGSSEIVFTTQTFRVVSIEKLDVEKPTT